MVTPVLNIPLDAVLIWDEIKVWKDLKIIWSNRESLNGCGLLESSGHQGWSTVDPSMLSLNPLYRKVRIFREPHGSIVIKEKILNKKGGGEAEAKWPKRQKTGLCGKYPHSTLQKLFLTRGLHVFVSLHYTSGGKKKDRTWHHLGYAPCFHISLRSWFSNVAAHWNHPEAFLKNTVAWVSLSEFLI